MSTRPARSPREAATARFSRASPCWLRPVHASAAPRSPARRPHARADLTRGPASVPSSARRSPPGDPRDRAGRSRSHGEPARRRTRWDDRPARNARRAGHPAAGTRRAAGVGPGSDGTFSVSGSPGSISDNARQFPTPSKEEWGVGMTINDEGKRRATAGVCTHRSGLVLSGIPGVTGRPGRSGGSPRRLGRPRRGGLPPSRSHPAGPGRRRRPRGGGRLRRPGCARQQRARPDPAGVLR